MKSPSLAESPQPSARVLQAAGTLTLSKRIFEHILPLLALER